MEQEDISQQCRQTKPAYLSSTTPLSFSNRTRARAEKREVSIRVGKNWNLLAAQGAQRISSHYHRQILQLKSCQLETWRWQTSVAHQYVPRDPQLVLLSLSKRILIRVTAFWVYVNKRTLVKWHRNLKLLTETLTLSRPIGKGCAVYMFRFPSYPGCRSPNICILKCLTIVSTTSLQRDLAS